MKYDPFYIADLLFRQDSEDFLQEEQEILDQWLASAPENQQLLADLEDPDISRRDWEDFNHFDPEKNWQRLQARCPALRRLNFDGSWAEPVPAAQRFGRLSNWISNYLSAVLIFVLGVAILIALILFSLKALNRSVDDICKGRPDAQFYLQGTN